MWIRTQNGDLINCDNVTDIWITKHEQKDKSGKKLPPKYYLYIHFCVQNSPNPYGPNKSQSVQRVLTFSEDKNVPKRIREYIYDHLVNNDDICDLQNIDREYEYPNSKV